MYISVREVDVGYSSGRTAILPMISILHSYVMPS
jgi:hypothetical protein